MQDQLVNNKSIYKAYHSQTDKERSWTEIATAVNVLAS